MVCWRLRSEFSDGQDSPKRNISRRVVAQACAIRILVCCVSDGNRYMNLYRGFFQMDIENNGRFIYRVGKQLIKVMRLEILRINIAQRSGLTIRRRSTILQKIYELCFEHNLVCLRLTLEFHSFHGKFFIFLALFVQVTTSQIKAECSPSRLYRV